MSEYSEVEQPFFNRSGAEAFVQLQRYSAKPKETLSAVLRDGKRSPGTTRSKSNAVARGFNWIVCRQTQQQQ